MSCSSLCIIVLQKYVGITRELSTPSNTKCLSFTTDLFKPIEFASDNVCFSPAGA